MRSRPLLTRESFLARADHTLLRPDVNREELSSFLTGARKLGVARVCISPSMLPASASERGDLEVVTVVGFPSGAHTAETKAFEARQACGAGADEIDMVINRALVRAGSWQSVENEVQSVREACTGAVLKVILEVAALTDAEIVGASLAARAAGADFVKTSTGFDAAGGASLDAVRLMAETVGDDMGVKASGGIRTAQDAREMWQAGATRFGVSATAAIVADWEAGTDSSLAGGEGY